MTWAGVVHSVLNGPCWEVTTPPSVTRNVKESTDNRRLTDMMGTATIDTDFTRQKRVGSWI